MQPKFNNAPHFKNYWESGSGKELLTWAKVKPKEVNFYKYHHLYHQVDELGDQVVKDTYLKLPYSEASSLINQFSTTKLTPESNAPESLRNLFLQMQEVPDWFDAEIANRGARFSMRTGNNALIVLRDFTLMGGYDFAYLNKPLIFTGALKKGAVKRLKDTLEFWINVTRENALDHNSTAYQLAVRTRLMHSYARLKIKEKAKDWDYQKWGEPINSWDMIATNLGFSLIFLQGIKRLGIKISEQEEEGVFHLWKYIGYLLGIPAEYLANNRQEAVEQFYWWTTIQDEGDADSVQLAASLLEENLENTIYKYNFQRKMLHNLHQSTNWFLLDQEIIKRLQIAKPSKAFSYFPKAIVKANHVFQKIYLTSPDRYEKLVNIGSMQQMKVLKDYIKHSPKDFHY